MFHFVVYGILLVILIMLIWMTYHFRSLSNENDNGKANETESENYKNGLLSSHNFIYAAIVLVIVTILVFTYLIVKGTPVEGHVMEWLNIVVRVMHITFGIAWIGASFYFVFLENALNRTENVRDELAGNLWAIHGGGFYYLEKYKTAPKSIPKHLHWFKYEAYFTWISGFSLLFIVYYFNAKGFLIDTNVFDMSPPAAITTGIGSFVVAWLLYDILCKTSLIKKGIWFTIVGVIIATAFAWFYCYVFSARAAYIHFGAMLGSIMVANVFFVIIPSQKAMVKAAKEGKPLNPQLGKHAGLRSLHNNYLTLPVLFVMVSNHFPTTFGFEYPWIILAAISLGSAGIKHWLNLREQGKYSVWVMPVSVLILLATAYVSAPPKPGECKTNINFAEVNAIVQKRCITCHSSMPTDDVIKAPPNGVTYDTPDNLVKLKDKIMQQVVITKTMPQNNKTNMTLEEREIIRCWIEQGAVLK
ncbi:MAG: urate hydroxylase PuuD [Chitinophagaceae bacterium]